MKKSAFIIFALAAVMLSACAKAPDDPSSDTSAESSAPQPSARTEAVSGEKTEKTPADDSIRINDVSVSFGSESGFYKKELTLEITCSDPDAVIYYTTDGNESTERSDRYSSPIKLSNKTLVDNVLSSVGGMTAGNDFIPKSRVVKANVIRAAAFLPDGSRSEIINGTFFAGVDRKTLYGDAPVISLITDTKNLYNYETGIFVLGKTHDDWLAEDPGNAKKEAWQAKGNYSNKGREWERPVYVEYFSPDGSSLFAQGMGMRVMGAASRNEIQKSLRLTAREEYGKKSVKQQIIPGNMRSDGSGEVGKYKSFVLRNGGNDCNFAKVRDPYLQSLVYDRRFETEQYLPAVVFIDGEYWGMYTLSENYNDNYIENNYGIDNNNVVIVKKGSIEDGKDEDMELYDAMYDFIVGNDMSDGSSYEKACGMLDMGSFADYCAFNLYIYNEDSVFKDNNWEMWRVRDADGKTAYSDGKWRMMVYDTDYSTGIYNEGKNFSKDNISEVIKGNGYTENNSAKKPADIFRALYKNDDFRRELVNAMCDIRNINFESETAKKALSDMSADYIKLAPDTFSRFGPDWVAWQDTRGYIKYRINELAVFIEGRYGAFPKIMQKAMKLGDAAEMSLSVSDGSKGKVMINSSGTDISGDFKGTYFTDFGISLKAVPDGGKFVRWEYENCTVSDETSPEITVTFGGDFTVRAVFE